jgi:hypothetical protein
MKDTMLGELLALYGQYVLSLYHDRQNPQEPRQQPIVKHCDSPPSGSCSV